MLSNLHVKNFALIDEADVFFSDKLNILTGETGAGKSLLLGAIGLALGARSGPDNIRKNEKYALAELTFTGISDSAARLAEELGYDVSGGELVISRKLMDNGRSVIRINGEAASVSGLKSIASELIDIYGQNEHQELLNTKNHLEIVDRFIPNALLNPLKAELEKEYGTYRRLVAERESLSSDEAVRSREKNLLEYEIEEIKDAGLTEGEEEELKEEHKLLANSHIVCESLGRVSELLYGESGCSNLLSDAIRALARVSDFDERISGFYDSMSDIDSCVSDLYRDISQFLSEIPEDDFRLNEIEERLDLISRLKSKYGTTVKEIRDFCSACEEELEKLVNYEDYEAKLTKSLKESALTLEKLSQKLSKLRCEAAAELEKRVTAAMKELNFNAVSFKVSFEKRKDFHPNGLDTAEFMISLNVGEDIKPLRQVASGGELSRIMLAIKSVLAGLEEKGTLLFDEIDAGISGHTAQLVSEKLAAISGVHQVLCITHLPQICSMADSHFVIEKVVEGERTATSIAETDEEGTVMELARMTSGAKITEAGLKGARETRKLATEKKTQIRKALLN